MKASELRIGNYVNVPIKEQCPFRIDAFEHCDEKFIKVAQKVKLNGFEVHPLTWYGGDLQPIPLSEEWLLKFGFEKKYWGNDKNQYPFMEKGLVIIDLLDYTIETASGLVIEMKYVHQLQNFYFALTGKELTLKP
jgi:hypothetical protein